MTFMFCYLPTAKALHSRREWLCYQTTTGCWTISYCDIFETKICGNIERYKQENYRRTSNKNVWSSPETRTRICRVFYRLVEVRIELLISDHHFSKMLLKAVWLVCGTFVLRTRFHNDLFACNVSICPWAPSWLALWRFL